MFKNFNYISHFYFVIISIFIIIISIFYISFTQPNNINKFSPDNSIIYNKIITSQNNICWPLPGYSRISSPFGYRNSPTAGATSFHGGVDLPAPAGTNIVSAISGKVIKTGFMGSGGCSIVVQNKQYTVIFHHISPNYLVSPGQNVTQGQIIAQVGPKNVYGFSQNPYTDSNR